MNFSQTQWEKTAVFLQTQTRPLERALFAYHFGEGKKTEVVDVLSAFQNEDGGFGHGIEPDVQLDDSSVLGTTVALQIGRALDLARTHPLIQGAMAYLHNTYSATHQSWPFVPETVTQAAHAPWWQYDHDYTLYRHNPRPEVVGYLLAWGDRDLGERVLMAVLAAGSQQETIEMHDLLCYQRLLETAVLPDDARRQLTPLVERWVLQLVETNPDKWGDYGLRPLAVAPTPDHYLAARFAEAIEQELTYLVRSCQADGAWWPTWSWGDAYADV
ncbi:MAG: hypothetical protein ACE5EY_04485 [Anaerolineae bacterium]